MARDWLNDPPATLDDKKVPPAPDRGKINVETLSFVRTEFYYLFKSMTKKITLSQDEVERISSKSIRGYDKWFRIYAGIASELERYENNILYLRIANTEKIWPSCYETAEKFACKWRNWNEELSNAEGFVVSFYAAGTTGCTVRGIDAINIKGLLLEKIQEVIAENKTEQKLTNIFSGMYDIKLGEEPQ